MTWRTVIETYAPPLLTLVVGAIATIAALTRRGDDE